MSGAYRFLPWTRRGLAAGIGAPDTFGVLPARAAVSVRLDLDGTGPVAGQVQLYGPGDVAGLDQRIVLRTDPRPGSVGVEPNYLAIIEFDPPDLPWLFTPAAVGGNGRLRPWLILVVVRDTDGITLAHDGAAPLPVLTIDTPADPKVELPDLADSWAWAHAQILHDDAVTLDVPADLAVRPAGNLSRLICPRRLEPDTSYLACVVPAFDSGVHTGLGLPAGTRPAGPAWDGNAVTPVRLPVYYHWRFATGPDGDIESLASALTPVPAPDELGSIAVQLKDSDPDLANLDPLAPGSVLLIHGALTAPPHQPPVPPIPQDPRVGPVLRKRVDNARANGTLGPPLYGEWHRDVHAVPSTGWLAEANAEAERRIAAGLGAAVVRARQEDLVQACWDQVGELGKANELLDRAVLSGHAARRLVERHLASLPPGRAAQITRSWQDRVPRPDSGQTTPGQPTVSGTVADSSLPGELMSPAYRRLAASRRPIARRAARAGLTRQRTVLDFDTTDVLGLDPAGPAAAGLDALTAVLTIPIPAPPPGGGPPSPVSLRRLGLPGTATAAQLRALQVAARSAHVSAISLGGGVGAGVLKVTDELDPNAPVLTTDPDQGAAARLSHVWAAVQARVDAPAVPTVFRSAGLAGLQQAVMQRADPRAAIARRTRGRLVASPEDPNAPPFSGLQPVGDGDVPSSVLAYPRIVTPVAGLLDALAGSWLLPGLDGLPQDSATLVQTNPAFVTACLLGANQELNAELLWREFPTDRRGTPLRRFWARRVESEDIAPIHTWAANSALADLAASTGDEQLVLVLRGRLLLRYPDIVVYAVSGDARGPHDANPAAIVLPVFSGRMSPDLSYVGFPISQAQAIANQTWFVLQQQPAGPRFGFDVSRDAGSPIGSWSDIAWSDVGVAPGGFLSPRSATVAALNLAVGGVGAGSVATHRFGPTGAEVAASMLQRPIRVAIHFSRLLPG